MSRRDFLYKRSQHQGLAARAGPVSLPGQSNGNGNGNGAGNSATPAASPTSSADPKTSDAINPLTVGPGPKTTDASSSAAPSAVSSSSASTPSSSSSSSSSSAVSSSSTSSSATPTTSHIVSTPLTAAATTAHSSLVTSQVPTGISFTPTSSASPATTSSAGSSSGTSTGAIVGGVAGTLAGIAVLGLLIMWCMRRQRNRDIDDFDAQAFKRQSAILVDDPLEPPRSYNPRPPTMIERHNASPALAAQVGHGGQNFYGNYGGYGQQASYGPEPVGSPPPQAYGAPQTGYAGYNDPQPSNAGYAGYDSQQQLARQPSNAQYLTRQPSPAGYAPPTAPSGARDPNAHYIDLNRSSVSPYQASQYADISRQLGTADPNGQAARQSLRIPDGPLPSPFDDPAEATSVPDVTSPHAHASSAAAPVPQMQGHASESRPATIYEEGDAYGGI